MATSSIEQYIPDAKTNDDGWILYYKKLRNIFSKKEANKYWLVTWDNNGGDANYHANTKNLRDYMITKSIDLTAPTTWGEITDKASDFGNKIYVIIIATVVVIMVMVALRVVGALNFKSKNSN